MNKLKKIGLTALATSLVAGSAYSADVTVSGAAGYTWTTDSGNAGAAGDHGKGIGTDNSLSFSASGELDNGWSVSSGTALTDAFALSSSTVTLTMGDMGSVTTGSGHGGSGASFDGETPFAYEEVDDGGATSLSTNLVGALNDGGAISYKSPALDLGGVSATIYAGYAPRATDTYLAGGAGSGASGMGSGMDGGILLSHDSGLTAGVYGAQRNRVGAAAELLNDAFEGTMFAKYAFGPVSVGYQVSYHDSGLAPSQAAVTSTKAVNTASGIFEGETMSIAFNVNDNLSVSYAKAEDTYDAQAGATASSQAGDAVADVDMEIKSIQAAYSMGSMSIKAYRTETSNVGYNTKGGSRTVNEIALGLSF